MAGHIVNLTYNYNRLLIFQVITCVLFSLLKLCLILLNSILQIMKSKFELHFKGID